MRGLCIITFIFCFLSEVIYGAACSGRTTYSAMGASGAFTTIGSGSGPGMVRLCVEGNTFSGGMCSTNDAGIYIYDCSLTNIYGIINENTPVGYCMSMNICDGCMNLRKICSGNSGDITLSWSTVKDGASLCTGPNTVAAYISVPSADCLGAIYISQDGTYPSIASGEGFEEFMCAGINGTTNGGCLTAQSSLNNFAGGEHNSRWYRFVPQTSGTLTIDIAPSANRDDYDFALWQSDDCNNLGTPLRCNYCDGNGSTGIGPTGVLPSTPVSVGCNNYSSTLNVTAGLTYYLLVNGFGFPLDPTFNITFGGTTSLKPSVLCPNLEINSTIENTTCGSANGSINLSPIEVGQYYNYRWNNGSTFQNLKYIGPGTYTVSVSPTNNPQCPTIKTFTVQGSSNTLVSSINGNLSICQGGSSNITATGGVLYTWNNGTSGPVLNISSSGNYIVTVTDIEGCTSVSSAECIIIPVSAMISGENTICKGDTITLLASGGVGYNWYNGSSGPILNVSSSGNYIVTVTNSQGCQSVSSFDCSIIEVSANISGENTICKGDTISLVASWGRNL
ncbi:MAG: hypothetical protein IPQ04_11170 [Saprospiraceae bacterium]|nr:hypothetical protein [Saprospiraceae bacterium]